MGGRAYRVGLVTPVAPPVGRAYRASTVGTAPADAPRGRAYRAASTGTVPASRFGRAYRAAVAGTASVLLVPFAPRTVEPMSTVLLTAALVGGGVADSFSWRQISGPTVSFSGSGASRSFPAPSTMAGDVVVVGVQATVGDTTSAEAIITITVLPQLTWIRTHTDPVWRGSRVSL